MQPSYGPPPPYNPPPPQNYGQQYQAPPGYANPTPDVNYDNVNYNYDPYHIQYNNNVTVQQWNTVPCDPSPYSQYWATPNSFQPQTFSQNTKTQKKWNDLFWAIFFWVNLLLTIAIAAFAGYKAYDKMQKQSNQKSGLADSKSDLNMQIVGRDIAIAFGIGFAFTCIHFTYAAFAPLCYIKFSLVLATIFSIIIAAVPFFLTGYWYFFLYAAVMALLALLMYCIMRPYIPFSAAVLKQTCWIIRKYPSIIAICALQIFIGLILNVLFAILALTVYYNEWSYAIYIYVVFSYYWVTLTFGYVTYMTGAGLAASWYFLFNTEYFPKNPTWESFKRATTTSFGSAALAGFLLAVIETLKEIIRSTDSNNIAVVIIKCVAMCILACLECLVKWFNRYALIYCAVFGVPFKEGCRRWTELCCKKFCDVIISGLCIGKSLGFNLVAFCVGSAAAGVGVGYLFDGKNSELWTNAIIVGVCAFLFCLIGFIILQQPLQVISDTIIICFCEHPEKLQTSARDLSDAIEEMYRGQLGKKCRSH